ncbi:50S ribosomal protein L10-like [Rattus rattus]|uniref:50S ribosomal protein L10-like n=1 Tax=Rattus rattus TaxID=10117 RepID=UPI0013F382CB|nr:50S ribosomal protein L10-like [Rattus rattus]
MGSRTKEIIEGKNRRAEELTKGIEEYGAFLVFEYLGLNAGEIAILKKKLRALDAKLIVHKNNTLNRSLRKLDLKYSEELKGPNAILLSRGNMTPFKEIIDLSKDKDFIKLKLAYLEKEVIEKENLQMLASLGSKEDLLVKLCQTLMSPLYKCAYLLKNIKN